MGRSRHSTKRGSKEQTNKDPNRLSLAASKKSTRKNNALPAKKNDKRSKTDGVAHQNSINNNEGERKDDDHMFDDSEATSSEEEEEIAKPNEGDVNTSSKESQAKPGKQKQSNEDGEDYEDQTDGNGTGSSEIDRRVAAHCSVKKVKHLTSVHYRAYIKHALERKERADRKVAKYEQAEKKESLMEQLAAQQDQMDKAVHKIVAKITLFKWSMYPSKKVRVLLLHRDFCP